MMSKTTSLLNVEVVSPYNSFTKQLSSSMKHGGIIRLPDEPISILKMELKNLRANKGNFPDEAITEIVSLLDEDEGICDRLEPKLFGTLLQALLQTAYSKTKERGLLLLAISLDNEHASDGLEIAAEKITTLGRDNIYILLASLVDTAEHARSRRWIGLMLQQLLCGSEENIYIFDSCPENFKRKIGSMVVEERNEILRVVLGQILKVLTGAGIPPENLWPAGTDPVVYSGIPLSTQTGNSWISAFQSYVDSIFEMMHAPEDNGNLYFAHKVTASPSEFLISGKSSIMVLIDDGVSICSLFNDNTFGGSLDFPFYAIASVSLERVDVGQKLAVTPFDVVIRMRLDDDEVCCVNGRPVIIEEIRILLTNQTQAQTIQEDLLLMRSRSKASQACDPISIETLTSLKGASLLGERKPGITSKASQAKENITIPAYQSPTPCQDGVGEHKSTIDEELISPTAHQSQNLFPELFPRDESPISTSDVQMFVEPPIIGSGAKDITDPSRQLSGIKSPQSLGSANAPINSTQDGARHNIHRDLGILDQAKFQSTFSEPISSPSNKVIEKMPSQINSDEELSSTSKEVIQNHAVKFQTKQETCARERTSKQTAEFNSRSVKTKELETPQKYGLIAEQTVQPKGSFKRALISSSEAPSANYDAIWDLPVDSVDIENSKTTAATALIAPKAKGDDISEDVVVSQKMDVKGKKRMATKFQSATVDVIQPISMPRSKRKAAQTANLKLHDSNSVNAEVHNDIKRPKRGSAPRRTKKDTPQESKISEGSGKPTLKRVKKGFRKVQSRSKSKREVENRTDRLVSGKTIKSNMDIPIREALNSDFFEPEAPNLEKHFQSDALNLGVVDGNSGFRDNQPIRISHNTSESGIEQGHGTLRLAQKLSNLLEGIDRNGQLARAIDQVSLQETGKPSEFRSGNILDSSELLDFTDSGNTSADEMDTNGAFPPLCGSDIERKCKEILRNDSKPQNSGNIHALHHPEQDNSTFLSKIVNERAFGNVSTREQRTKKTSRGKQETASIEPEINADKRSLQIPTLDKEFSADIRSTSPNALPASGLKCAQLPPSKSQMLPSLLIHTEEASMLDTSLAKNDKSGVILIDERLARKTPLVGFDMKGAQNQGNSTNAAVSIMQNSVTRKFSPLQESVKETREQQRKKRDRDEDGTGYKEQRVSVQKAQEKSHISSEASIGNSRAQDRPLNSDPVFVQQIPTLGSRSSRVDPNGSPRALASIRNFERCLRHQEAIKKPDPNYQNDVVMEIDSTDEEPLCIDGEIISKCVPHRKTTGRSRERPALKRTVPIQHIAMDPFLTNDCDRKPSKFARLLRGGGIKQVTNSSQDVNRKKKKSYGFTIRRGPDKKLVEHSTEFSLNEKLARENFDESGQSSYQTDSDITDGDWLQWAHALKPHYKGMRQTLVRLVDDIVRNFIDHESAIDDALEDYNCSGAKLVEELASKQETNIQHNRDGIQSMSIKMTGLHKRAQERIMQHMRPSSLNNFEREWRKQHQELQNLIEKRRVYLK